MFADYTQLIKAASFKGSIAFEERKAVRFFVDQGKAEPTELSLPMLNMLYIPSVPDVSDGFMGMLYSKGFLEYSKMFSAFMQFGEIENLPDVKDKEFYVYALHHGFDYGHHGEACITGLLLESEHLESNLGRPLDENSDMYKLLLTWEQFDTPQNHGGAIKTFDRLEHKIVKLEIR